MKEAKCKICRRAGEKLFLKGERCLSPKCAMVKRPYPPGQKGKRRRRRLSEYGKELKEKQKLRNWYNLSETQFKRYIKEVMGHRKRSENTSDLLIKKLEFRLDNAVFRLGFASSRPQARQLVSHGFFKVNGRPTNIPSYQLKEGDVVSLKKEKKKIEKQVRTRLKDHEVPSWLQFNSQKLEGKVKGSPTLEDVSPPVEMAAIFEFYSR